MEGGAFYIMMFLKWTSDDQLIITSKEPIYRGENLSKKITYLLPLKVGEIDVAEAFVYLCCIRPDGTPDIIMLNRSGELYNASYYQFTLPVTCKLTRYAGELCTWLQIFTGPSSMPTTAKSGECTLQILSSKNVDDYLCDHQISAIYQLSRNVKETNTNVEQIVVEMDSKAEGIIYDDENNTLHLTKDGELIGDPIDMDEVMDNNNEVITFGESDIPAPEEDNDKVIEF